MSRRSKGTRLYLRKARVHARTGKPVPAVWVIRDGATEVSTGYGPGCAVEAEQALGAYITDKWAQETPAGDPADEAKRRSDPSRVFVAEVVAYYAEHKAPKVADPVSARGRLRSIVAFPGFTTLNSVKRSTCEAYVAWRTAQPIKAFRKNQPRMVSAQAARRELEDLSSSIGYWDDEFHLTRRPKVSLPEKPDSPRDALTRSEAAALLWAAMGWRKGSDGRWKRLGGSARANRAHVRRFILTGLYTGTRPGVIPKVLWHESATQAWADLDAGVIHRRGKAEKDHKTKRRPMVKIPRRLLAHMRRWKAMDERAIVEARERGEDRVLSTMLHHGGEPITGPIRRAFASCVRDAGLNPEITPHWMRHTCATWLMRGGAELWDAAAFAGMTVATLEKCYGHHRPDHQAGALKAAGGKRVDPR